MKLFLLAALSFGAAAQESEVRTVLKTQQEAWNRGDLVAFMDAYENSPDIAFVGKTGVRHGYQEILERYRSRYGTREAMGQLGYTILEFHALGDAFARLVGKFELQRTAAGGGNASGYFTLIFRKTPKGWKIIHDHTS
jgi:ketosteroid isomerase-like protein